MTSILILFCHIMWLFLVSHTLSFPSVPLAEFLSRKISARSHRQPIFHFSRSDEYITCLWHSRNASGVYPLSFIRGRFAEQQFFHCALCWCDPLRKELIQYPCASSSSLLIIGPLCRGTIAQIGFPVCLIQNAFKCD
jgi:hypothetical protein